MTRKDYQAIAAALRRAYLLADAYASEEGKHAVYAALRTSTVGIADAMAADNPAFNRQRFYDAVQPDRHLRADGI